MAEIERLEALQKTIMKEYPDLTDEEVTLRASQFMELGSLMVRLWLKERKKPPKIGFIPDFQGKAENPPPDISPPP